MFFLLESIYNQFNSLQPTKLKIRGIQPAAENTSIVIAEVLNGCISTYDYIQINKHITEVLNVFVNNQQVYTAVTGEVAELVIRDIGHVIAKSKKTSKIIADSVNRDLITLQSVAYINAKQLPFSKLPTISEQVTQKVLSEGVIDLAKTKGLAVLRSGVKGLGVAAILSIFAYALYNKLNKPCLTKVGLDKIKCQKQVADRIVSELTRQQAYCNQLTDVKRRQDCLKKVETKKKEWILKSTQLAELLHQKTKV